MKSPAHKSERPIAARLVGRKADALRPDKRMKRFNKWTGGIDRRIARARRKLDEIEARISRRRKGGAK